MAGQIVHFEVKAEDPDRATEFYRSVFGWDFSDSGMPGIDYRMVRTGESQGGGLYQSDDRDGHLTIYFDTDDIDATIAKIRESGGQVDEKQPIPGVGWFAPAKDSEGNAFSLFQSDESVPMPEQ